MAWKFVRRATSEFPGEALSTDAVAGSGEHPLASPINSAMHRTRTSHVFPWPRNETVVFDVFWRIVASDPAANSGTTVSLVICRGATSPGPDVSGQDSG